MKNSSTTHLLIGFAALLPCFLQANTYTFTSADVTGSAGPTQGEVDSNYSGTNLAGSGYDQHPRHSGMERARKWVLQHRSIRRARGQQPLGDWRQGSPNERNLFSGLRQLAEDCGRSPGILKQHLPSWRRGWNFRLVKWGIPAFDRCWRRWRRWNWDQFEWDRKRSDRNGWRSGFQGTGRLERWESEEPVEPTVREDRRELEGMLWAIRGVARVGCLREAEPIPD